MAQERTVKNLNWKTLLWVLPLVVWLTLSYNLMKTVPMWQDEYVFYRLTSQLPSLAVTKDWFYVDNPKTLVPSSSFPVDREELFRVIYNTPIYSHSPLANYLVWPFVKTVNILAEKGVIPRIEDTQDLNKAETMTVILRIVSMVLFASSMIVVFKLMQLKVRNSAYAYSIPVFMSIGLLLGGYYFYWDTFMWFFFVLSLYLSERKSRWAYVIACFLVNTKAVIGMVLLVPLIIQNRKMAYTLLSIVPFYIASAVITGNPFYTIAHLIPQTSQYTWIYRYWTPVMIKNFGLAYYAFLTLPILLFVKKYPVYVATYLISLWYAWGFGIAPDKMVSMLYGGALVFPLIVHEVYERTKGRLRLEVARQ